MAAESQVARTAKPKVAVLTRFFDPAMGGAERYAVRLVEELADKYEFHVFAQRIGHAHPLVRYTQLPWSRRTPRWINQLLYVRRVQKLTALGFDLIHSNENGWIGDVQIIHVRPMRFNLFCFPKLVRRLLNALSVLTSPRLMAYLWMEKSRMAPELNAQIVPVSDLIEGETVAAYPYVKDRLTCLMPGVDVPPFSSWLEDKLAMREKLGLNAQRKFALFVASNFEKKGLDVLLQALGNMPLDLDLLLVGGEDFESHYRARIAQMGLSARVHYLGRLADVAPAYKAADLLLHPTTQDSYGMVVVEAMAHGLSVVVTGMPYCGVSAYLTHQKNAWILQRPDDGAAIVQAVNSILTDEPLREQLGKAGYEFACDNSWQSRGRQLDELYQALIRARRDISR
jgi:glycosyltransferase involved in cell wall biosynthesis